MTVAELLLRVSSHELGEWMMYHKIKREQQEAELAEIKNQQQK